nr:MAG TPA: hypothetical protein [Bacteriophage sp.]
MQNLVIYRTNKVCNTHRRYIVKSDYLNVYRYTT